MPFFAALPPADLPTVAYVPTALHAAEMVTERHAERHTVRSGDTVYGIAARYGVSPTLIVHANNLSEGGRWILPGTTLVVPAADSAPTSAKSSKAATSKKTATPTSKASPAGARITVRHGDTLSHLAARHGTTVTKLAAVNKLRDSRLIYPGQVLVLPGSTPVASPASGSSSGASTARPSSGTATTGKTVTVRSGDTLSGIAARHGVSVSALAKTNRISVSDFIFPGQKLRLPGSGAGAPPATDKAPASPSPAKDSAPSGAPSSSPAPVKTVTVRSGDTLGGIAAKHGASVTALAALNRLSAPYVIYPGQTLRLTGGAAPAKLDRPYDPSTIGDKKKGEKVDDTFLHYRYSDGVARSAAANREYLSSIEVPSREYMKDLIVQTSNRYGVDPDLMVSLSYQESGWNMRAVSPANAIGVMQVIPMSGDWASSLVGRELNLLDPADNVEAGVVIMRALLAATEKDDHAIGGYYQGLASVRQHGLFPDTKQYVRNIRHFMRTL